jgi:hypothetical protein
VEEVPTASPGLADLLEPDAPAIASPNEDSGAVTLEHPAPPLALDEMPTPIVPTPIGKPPPRGEAGDATRNVEVPPAADPLGAEEPLVIVPGREEVAAQDEDAVTIAREIPRASPAKALVDEAPREFAAGPEAEPPKRRMPWLWVTLTLMMGGALAWVVATQTDLLEGDVIASRDQQATKETEEARAAAEEAARKAQKEYGTATITSEPKGARVWMIRRGAEVTFENLPRAHEYVFMIDAPGQQPQVRRIKGTEIGGTVTVDLDPLADADAHAPLPESDPPRLADTVDPEDVGELRLASPDTDARFGLLVGYTPGVRLEDLEVGETWELLVTKEGHAPHTETIKGRHWEEAGDALIYSEKVELRPLTPEEMAEADSESDATDGEGGTERDEASEGSTEAAMAEASDPKPKKRKRRKKKKKRKKK